MDAALRRGHMQDGPGVAVAEVWVCASLQEACQQRQVSVGHRLHHVICDNVAEHCQAGAGPHQQVDHVCVVGAHRVQQRVASERVARAVVRVSRQQELDCLIAPALRRSHERRAAGVIGERGVAAGLDRSAHRVDVAVGGGRDEVEQALALILGAMLSQRVLHLHQVGQLARRVLVCRRQQLVEEFVWHIRSADIGVAGEPGVVLHHERCGRVARVQRDAERLLHLPFNAARQVDLHGVDLRLERCCERLKGIAGHSQDGHHAC
mmetsp:Transcript_37685/g.111553  ORF Transcript_37685/g.111553 Transcript_37685/m.111553 type:complete len:264 (-) Transcript_37685:687-1478(-)